MPEKCNELLARSRNVESSQTCQARGTRMKVLLAAAECSPLARTGGLGEAVAGLAGALSGRGVDVTVVIPRYRHLGELGVREDAPGPAKAVWRLESNGVPVLLVDDPPSFDRVWYLWPRPRFGIRRPVAPFRPVLGRGSPPRGRIRPPTPARCAHTGSAALHASRANVVFTIHNALYPILGPLDEAADAGRRRRR